MRPQHWEIREMTRNQHRTLRRGARVVGGDPGELPILEDQGMEDASMPLVLTNSWSKVGVGDWSLMSAS